MPNPRSSDSPIHPFSGSALLRLGTPAVWARARVVARAEVISLVAVRIASADIVVSLKEQLARESIVRLHIRAVDAAVGDNVVQYGRANIHEAEVTGLGAVVTELHGYFAIGQQRSRGKGDNGLGGHT